MPQRPEHWSVAKRFAYEFGSTARHLKTFSMQYGMAAVAFVLVVSCITWARTEASASDLPLVLLASVIHLLRGIAIVSLLFAWLGARVILKLPIPNSSIIIFESIILVATLADPRTQRSARYLGGIAQCAKSVCSGNSWIP